MNQKPNRVWLYAIVGILLYGGGWLHSQYVGRVWPFVSSFAASSGVQSDPEHSHTENGHIHDHGDHDHGGSSNANILELTESAKKNLGLTDEYLQPIELQNYQQTITVPAIVVDRPGRTRLPISASMTGIVTHVHASTGEAVEPGDLIMEMRLTHEDLVTAQKDYLQTLGDRDIELKEIKRIEGMASSGAMSPKTLLDREYSRDKLESLLRSQREALRLHGLSDVQITSIDNDRRLLTEIRVYAPKPDEHSEEEFRLGDLNSGSFDPTADAAVLKFTSDVQVTPFRIANFQNENADGKHDHHDEDRNEVELGMRSKKKQLLVLQELNVQKGQIVNAGDTLCVMADYAELLAEGQAFETEANQIASAKVAGWTVSALLGVNGKTERIDNLPFGWINNEVDPVTRTLKFYVSLENQLLEDDKSASGQRHISWKFRTGQRMELGVPIQQWTEQIVLPVDAVVREGIESFVFQQNGDHFERIPVHERFRDQSFVVVENDGAIFPGDVVAMRGAHQMQMALKSKSGGGIDPHAGHNH